MENSKDLDSSRQLRTLTELVFAFTAYTVLTLHKLKIKHNTIKKQKTKLLFPRGAPVSYYAVKLSTVQDSYIRLATTVTAKQVFE